MNKLISTLTENKNNLFQSKLWLKYHQMLGHEVFTVSCDEGSANLIKIPLYKDKNYLYCPRGPKCSKEGWHVFVQRAKVIARENNCIFLRVEPFTVPVGVIKKLNFIRVGKFSPLSRQFSPMDTQVLDVDRTEDEIIAEMKPKWRYNIKLATRKGVTIRRSVSLDDLKVFHKLSLGMENRGYTPFDLEHYEKLLGALEKENIELFVAETGKKILAVILVTYYGEVATYLHGASSDESRELMPNHLLQWRAIQAAKEKGCKVYDFWGVAPDGDAKHSWAGITRFKKGFGGETIHFMGAYDYTFSSFWYIIFCLANFIRKLIRWN